MKNPSLREQDGEYLTYAADLDIIRHCRANGLAVRTHPFFRDMEKAWPFVLCELRDATVIGESFNPICDDEMFLECVTFDGRRDLKRLLKRDDDAPRRTFETDKAFLLGGDRAWGHFIVFYIMRAIYLQLFPELKSLPVITMAGLQPSLYEILAIFGCPKDRLIELDDNDAIHCKELFVPTVAGGAALDGLSISVPDKLTRLYHTMILQAHGGPNPTPPTAPVYVRRTKTNTKLILNDDAVTDYFVKAGYTVADPASMSLREQVELAQTASFIVSCWGSQIHLADFAQPVCKVAAMVCPDHIYQRSFDPGPRRFNALGMDFFASVSDCDGEGNLRIDIAKLAKDLNGFGFPS